MIKKTIAIVAIAAFVLTVSCKKPEKATMDFTEKTFDFGKINAGDKVEHVFTFKNNGGTDLIIKDAKGSCGCTVPEYPKDPVKPGAEEKIKVIFNSQGKHGKQQKSVSILANTKNVTEIINITAEVTPESGIIASPAPTK